MISLGRRRSLDRCDSWSCRCTRRSRAMARHYRPRGAVTTVGGKPHGNRSPRSSPNSAPNHHSTHHHIDHIACAPLGSPPLNETQNPIFVCMELYHNNENKIHLFISTVIVTQIKN